MPTIRTLPAGPRRESVPIGRSVPLVCVTAAALLLYWDAFTSGMRASWPSFAVLAACGLLAIHMAREARDPFHPLALILGLAVARLGLPAAAVALQGTPTAPIVEEFALLPDDLVQGQHLAAMGLLATVIGWYLSPAAWNGVFGRLYRAAGRVLPPDPRVAPAAATGYLIGIAVALTYLALSFGNPLAAILSGVARGDSAPGTSRYGFFAVGLLITSATILAFMLALRPGASRLRVWAPPLLASVILTVFGGRVVALTPLFLVLVGTWYLRASGLAPARPPIGRGRALTAAAAAGLLLFAYVSFVPLYRGGGGLEALPEALSASNLQRYAEATVWTEFGALQPYALAVRLGDGSIDGATYPGVLGVVGQAAGIGYDRPGNVMVQVLGPGGFSSDWGFQTGLMIDGYLNSGLVAALLFCVLFGAVLRAEYSGFRRSGRGFGAIVVHCLAVWTAIWVYFESIVVLPNQFQVVLPVVALIMLLASNLPRPRRS